MATITCREFLSYLEPWMEGERPPDAQAHVRTCSHCSGVIKDLEMIHSEARSWNALEQDAPERVWTSLRAQLEQEGLIRETIPASDGRAQVAAPRAGWFAGLFPRLPRPVLAGAYLAALVAVAFALSGPVNKRVNEARWLKGTQNSNSYVTRSNPVVAASLHQNLAIVDNYIALCEKSVSEDPQNEVARDYLFEAYQQKADLLTQLTERGENVQ